MGMILKSEKNGYVLKVGNGVAVLEIEGKTHHLGKPYLFIKYVEGEKKIKKKKIKQKKGERIFAGYDVEGLIFGWATTDITTNKLLSALHELGFCISSNQLREGITQDIPKEGNALKLGA